MKQSTNALVPHPITALLEKAAAAGDEAHAAQVLSEAGYPADLAEETAAIMFGTSQGDAIEIDDVSPSAEGNSHVH
jgi:hypothetical protein